MDLGFMLASLFGAIDLVLIVLVWGQHKRERSKHRLRERALTLRAESEAREASRLADLARDREERVTGGRREPDRRFTRATPRARRERR